MSTKAEIKVYVEKASDGTYWGTTQNVPGVVSAFGMSLKELEHNLTQAFNDYIEVALELKEKWVKDFRGKDIVFDYKLDLKSFFDLIPEVKISNLANKAKMNPSLLRQYKTGRANASVVQLRKIQRAVHELGEELLSVSF